MAQRVGYGLVEAVSVGGVRERSRWVKTEKHKARETREYLSNSDQGIVWLSNFTIGSHSSTRSALGIALNTEQQPRPE